MINWGRVEELRQEIGEEDFVEVAEMFLLEVDDVIRRLKANPAPEGLEQDLHFLKGSALNIGFENFSKLCHQGERLAAGGDFADINLTPLFEAYSQSRSEFASSQLPMTVHMKALSGV